MKPSARGAVSLGPSYGAGKHARVSRMSYCGNNNRLAGPLWIDHRAVPRKSVLYVDVLAAASVWRCE